MWDLTCESDPDKTRDTVMWTFSHPFSMPTRVKVALGFSYTILAIEIICCGCAGFIAIKEGQNEPITGGRAVATCCGCIFMLNVVWMLATAVGMQDENIETLENYSIINGCSDEYTHIPTEKMSTMINKSTENLKLASFISYGLLAIYFAACCIVSKQIADENR